MAGVGDAVVVALLLVFQMLMRLALLDVLIVLSPVMVLLWVLPQTQGWTRWWAHLFGITVFQQAVQMVVLRLGAALLVYGTVSLVASVTATGAGEGGPGVHTAEDLESARARFDRRSV